MFKKALIAVITAALCIGSVSYAAEKQPAAAAATTGVTPTIYVNGVKYVAAKSEASPFVTNEGRVIVPVMFFSTGLGVPAKNITYNQATKIVAITYNKTLIEIPLNARKIGVNGKVVPTDSPSFEKNGSLYVPLKYVANAMGLTVKVNQENVVKIFGNVSYKPAAPPAGSGTAAGGKAPSNNELFKANLAKLGLKAKVSLPLKLTASDFSYTLEKLMIYPIGSPEARALIDKYKLVSHISGEQKYLFWTEFTIANNNAKPVGSSTEGNSDKMSFFGVDTANDGLNIHRSMQQKKLDNYPINSPDYLWHWKLNKGEKVRTKLAYVATNDGFVDLSVALDVYGKHEMIKLASQE